MKRKLPQSLALVSALLIAAAALLWLPAAPWISPKPARIWQGYHVLSVRAGTVGGENLAAALRALGSGVVSEATSPVSFSDFEGLESCPYADLDRRIDPSDPRRDPFLEGIRGYFRVYAGGVEWKVAYIPAKASGFSLFLRLVGLLGFPARGEWRLTEFDPLEKILTLLVPLTLTVLLALSLEERKGQAICLSFSGALLWAPFLLAGGLAELSLCLVLLFAWYPLMSASLALLHEKARHGWVDPDRTEIGTRLAAYIVSAVAAIVLFLLAEGFSLFRLIGSVTPVVSSLLLLGALMPLSSASKVWRRKRMLFEPVPIVRTRVDSLRNRPAALLFASVGILVVALFSLARGMALPVPLTVVGARDFSWRSLARLPSNGRIERLPGFSDFVAHVAYQEALSFGRPWRLPMRDERVYVTEYLSDPSARTITARQRTVKVFDDEWLAELLRSPATGSVEAMLIAQGRPVAAALRGPVRYLAADLPFTILALCVLLSLLGREYGIGPLIRGNLWRFNGAARRNQIP